jgi:SNF2 family DNA or RNA helicase
MGDVMGLGKTIQSICALELRQAITKARQGSKSQKPFLIVCPNDSLKDQWGEELIKAGVDKSFIEILRVSSREGIRRGPVYYLCTRYDLLKAMRSSFVKVTSKCKLFPSASEEILDKLQNQYLSSKGKAKNKYNETESGDKIPVDALVTTFLADEMKKIKQNSVIFEAVLFDEAVSWHRYLFERFFF